jgi:hypothetical protein
MTHPQRFRRTALLLGSTLAACSVAWAAPKFEPSPQARFQQERAACMAGINHQDRATCLYEARSAFDQARRGDLDDRGAPYEANARKRCEPLPTDERVACLLRMDGEGLTLGSVEEGGIYRELVLIEHMDPAPGNDNEEDKN